MAVLVGADGAARLDLGNGLEYIANIFSWEARLRREMLRQTTQADNYERRTAGLGDWTGSFSFYLQFSDDTAVALSSWQLLEHALTQSDDGLKASIDLVLQRHRLDPDWEIFGSTIPGTISLQGTVVIGDLSLNCKDPEQPIVADASWAADGPLTPHRSDAE